MKLILSYNKHWAIIEPSRASLWLAELDSTQAQDYYLFFI